MAPRMVEMAVKNTGAVPNFRIPWLKRNGFGSHGQSWAISGAKCQFGFDIFLRKGKKKSGKPNATLTPYPSIERR